MILVDTSVWLDHLCKSDQHQHWQDLPAITRATDAEALYSLEHKHLMGKGIGYVDLHLLTSVLLSPGTKLWTRDLRLKKLAETLGHQWQSLTN